MQLVHLYSYILKSFSSFGRESNGILLNMRINLSCLHLSISELWLKGRLWANNDFVFCWSANPLILEMFGSVDANVGV